MTFSRADLAIARLAYAKQILAAAGITNEALEFAFATVPREDFVGKAPWYIARGEGYHKLPSSDPVVLYQDCLIALQQNRLVNNGSPTLHARGIHNLAISAGHSIAHIGAGTGYYSALQSVLVGATGRVLAVEQNASLKEQCVENLHGYANVSVIQGNGSAWPQEQVDRVYVNFATARPAQPWIENLAIGGRLLFPLCAPQDAAVMGSPVVARGIFLLIERKKLGYTATVLGSAFFVWDECDAGETPEYLENLKRSLNSNQAHRIKSLRVGPDDMGNEWLSSETWGLSYEEVND
ncbi:protein-L-isoaspartate O-methyltransferase family protein [Rhizobium sp. C4]|uniref:protein-L-isoaspartate O-methyltransferase family protein n=1 Tax=Rhizobium sp. C4 TaxID=1349800 RepID=UPI001E4F8FB3|nr:protein-L-isoaspartate carboxylmethyltransferase [Rhizobium sp. C4]MCD2175100.1 protein-L-isoaspartate carboxylmethyltransferase [Rhizobium sp. C4]